jgi:hypothetical protein
VPTATDSSSNGELTGAGASPTATASLGGTTGVVEWSHQIQLPKPAGGGHHTVDYRNADGQAVVLVETHQTGPGPARPAQANSWALIDLLIALVTALMAVVLSAIAMRRADQDGIGDEDEETAVWRRRRARLAILVALAAAVVFLVTQDLTQPMALTGPWTFVMGLLLLAQMVVARKQSRQALNQEPSYLTLRS